LPDTERGLRTALDRIAPALRLNGVAVKFEKDANSRRSIVCFSGRLGGGPVDEGVRFTVDHEA
jgi:hypothetical protein